MVAFESACVDFVCAWGGQEGWTPLKRGNAAQATARAVALFRTFALKNLAASVELLDAVEGKQRGSNSYTKIHLFAIQVCHVLFFAESICL